MITMRSNFVAIILENKNKNQSDEIYWLVRNQN